LHAQRLRTFVKRVPYLYRCLRWSRGLFSSIALRYHQVVFFFGVAKFLRDIDLLVASGSGQIQDSFGTAWDYPFDFFIWSLAAKLTKTRFVIISVGATPLKRRLSRFFFRAALHRAEFVSLRDCGSQELVHHLGYRGKTHVYPDLAHGLRFPRSGTEPGDNGSIVGINPLPVYHLYWTKSDESLYKNYVHKVADVAQWLLENQHKVSFFPTQIRSDPVVICDIMNLLRSRLSTTDLSRIHVADCSSVDDLLLEIDGLDLVIASRFHAILFSYLLNKPTVSLSYARKIDELLAELGQLPFCLSVYEFDLEAIKQKILLAEKVGKVGDTMPSRRIAKYRNDLDRQYRTILGLV
jgi:polysaccharide pyruvyl transferase WcaK-like protein